MSFLLNTKSLLMLSIAFGLVTNQPLLANDTQTETLPLSAEKSEEMHENENAAYSDFVFKYLVAEVAIQRGELGLAAQLFLDLAKAKRDVKIAERATQLAIYTQNTNTGLAASNLWMELNPDALEPRQTATQILVMAGNLGAAKPHLEKLLSKEETRANGFLFLNTLLENQTDKAAVLLLVQNLAQPYPKLAEAHLTVSQAAFHAQMPELALKEIMVANQLKSNWELGAIQQAEILYQQSPEKAINFYRQFLSNNAQANDARLNLVKMLVSQKKFKDAQPELKKLAKAAEKKPELLALVGMLAIQSNAIDDAENYLKQALNSAFKDKELIYLYLGQLAEKKQKTDEALNWYSQIQAPSADLNDPLKSSHYLEAQMSSALIIARTKGVDAAISLLDELQNLSTTQLSLVIQTQANLLMQAKRFQEGFDLLDKAVINLPENAELIYDHAMAAERLEKFEVVEAQLRKLIKLKPNFSQAYNALGYSFADRNIHLEEAYQLIEKALSFNPNDHFVMDSMGWVNYRLGKLDQAAQHLMAAYNIQADTEIAAHLGEVLWQQGKLKEAEKIWGDALKAAPDNEVLLKTIKQFKP
jgi:tetratricopeptide (TPR) repeat protein